MPIQTGLVTKGPNLIHHPCTCQNAVSSTESSADHGVRDGPEVMTDHNTLTKHHKGTYKIMSGQTSIPTEERGNHFQQEMSMKAV